MKVQGKYLVSFNISGWQREIFDYYQLGDCTGKTDFFGDDIDSLAAEVIADESKHRTYPLTFKKLSDEDYICSVDELKKYDVVGEFVSRDEDDDEVIEAIMYLNQ
jgi:hypothetical protein